ncbi:MAG: response regulator transcription factor [Pelagimonas sp.]|nr:response regulator transcription factor [Pelagimonas sp.]
MRFLIAETSWPMISLAQNLEERGILVTRIDRPEDTPHYVHMCSNDLVLLEAELLGPNKLTLPELKAKGPESPLALFVQEMDPAQISALLTAGADSVMGLSAPIEETEMRLRAIACRALGLAVPMIDLGPLQVDLGARRAYLFDCPLKLSPKQYELLEFFALRPNMLLNRTELLTHIYGFEQEPDPRVFDVYVCNLRSYLKPASDVLEIETVRGVGYRLVAPSRAELAA